eukprot:GILK01012653.1.p1 GENE.GILK01012653.1~~GILK01012653.1.p1  ORF type:complete len:606 (+),score=112.71 GILK01012653.1:36-1853(+)
MADDVLCDSSALAEYMTGLGLQDITPFKPAKPSYNNNNSTTTTTSVADESEARSSHQSARSSSIEQCLSSFCTQTGWSGVDSLVIIVAMILLYIFPSFLSVIPVILYLCWRHVLPRMVIRSLRGVIVSHSIFDRSVKRALQRVQETEIVARGFKILEPLPPISRMEQKSSPLTCIELRQALVEAVCASIHTTRRATHTARHTTRHTTQCTQDTQHAQTTPFEQSNGSNGTGTTNAIDLQSLKNLFNEFHSLWVIYTLTVAGRLESTISLSRCLPSLNVFVTVWYILSSVRHLEYDLRLYTQWIDVAVTALDDQALNRAHEQETLMASLSDSSSRGQLARRLATYKSLLYTSSVALNLSINELQRSDNGTGSSAVLETVLQRLSNIETDISHCQQLHDACVKNIHMIRAEEGVNDSKDWLQQRIETRTSTFADATEESNNISRLAETNDDPMVTQSPPSSSSAAANVVEVFQALSGLTEEERQHQRIQHSAAQEQDRYLIQLSNFAMDELKSVLGSRQQLPQVVKHVDGIPMLSDEEATVTTTDLYSELLETVESESYINRDNDNRFMMNPMVSELSHVLLNRRTETTLIGDDSSESESESESGNR